MIDQPILQIDSLLLPASRGVAVSPIGAQPLSLDFAIGQFHLIAGENITPLAELLRIVAGYDAPGQGRLLMRGQPLAGVPLGARNIATLTGEPRLFPQLTIGRNILFPLSGERRIGDTATAVAGAALRVGLSAAMLDRYPDEVTLATQLRAALARALALGPGLLQDLRRLQRDLSLTIICASDRLPSWAPIADRITLLETTGGQLRHVIQSGSAEDIYLRPESRSAARLSGATNLLPIEIMGRAADMLHCRSTLIDPPTFALPVRQVATALWRSVPEASVSPETTAAPAIGSASLLLRPSLLRPGLGIRRQDFRIEGRIQDRFSDGATVVLQVLVPAFTAPLIASMPAPAPFPLEQGMAVSLGWNRGDMRLLPDELTMADQKGRMG